MNPSNFGKCQIVCWVIAVVAGMLAFWMAIGLVGGIAAFMLGLAFIFFVGLVLTQLFCDGSKAGTHYEKGTTGASAEAPPSAAAAAEAASAAAAAKAKAATAKVEAGAASVAAATAAKVKAAEAKAAGSGRVAAAVADKAAADTAAVAAADKSAKDKASADKKAADKKAKAKAAADKAAKKKAAADKAAADEAAKSPDYDKDGVHEGTDEGTRPEALSGPRGGKADNLKEIKGVGPKMEIMCNEMGFYHFDQIAAWGADEVAWVDANLKGFKGRVSRDNWVEQAKILAAGGETEFSKRVEDGDVY